MKIITTKGVYDIRYDWDRASIVKKGKHFFIELSFSYTPFMYIGVSSQEEGAKVLSKLSK